MDMDRIRGLPIEDFLARLGYSPVWRKRNDLWYNAPYREERTPSFKVNTDRNVWFDFGLGRGGDIFTLAGEFAGSTDFLTQAKYISEAVGGNFVPLPTPRPAKERVSEPAFQEVEQRTLLYGVLKGYLSERGIPSEVAARHCRQVSYRVHEKPYFAIGFQNVSGGWELRSPQFKGSSAPKSITTFDRHGDTALLFEGFFDLLSYLTLQHKATPTADTAVLNSVVNLPRALPFLARHTTIHAFLDNDEAGRLTLERLRSALPGATVIDRAESYRAHKDLNESLRPSAKVSRTPRRRGRKL